MAFYKKKKLSDGKWHALAVSLGKPATIDEVANRLSQRSTVSRADTYAVLVEMGEVLGELLSEGRSVKLKGVGTFFLTCRTRGKGTATPEELTPDKLTDIKVRFIPEYSRGHRMEITKRTMIDPELEWIEIRETDE